MSLNPRAIALQGIGFAQRVLAAQGFAATGAPTPTRPGGWSDRPWRDIPFTPVAPRRRRKKRQDEVLFLGP